VQRAISAYWLTEQGCRSSKATSRVAPPNTRCSRSEFRREAANEQGLMADTTSCCS
jgi:hypothetical protein